MVHSERVWWRRTLFLQLCGCRIYAMQFKGRSWESVRPQISSRGRGLREQIAIHIQNHAKEYRQFWCPTSDLGANTQQIEDGDMPDTGDNYVSDSSLLSTSPASVIRSFLIGNPATLTLRFKSLWLLKVVTMTWRSPSQVSNFPKNCAKWLLTLKKVTEWPLCVVEPRVKFQALLANPGYLAVLTKRGFLGLPRLAPSKLLLRLGLGLPPAWCSRRPAISRNYSASGRFRSQPSSSSQSPLAVQGQQRPFHWVCDVCHQEISGTSVRDLLHGFVCLGLCFFSDFFNHARQVLMHGRKNGQLSLNLKSLPGKRGNAV